MKSFRRVVFSSYFALVCFNALLLVVVSQFYLGSMIEKQSLVENELMLKSVSENLTQYFKSQEKNLVILFNQELRFQKTEKQIQKSLFNFLAYNDFFSTLHYYAPDGRLIASAKKEMLQAYRPENNYHERKSKEFEEQAEKAYQEKKPIWGKTFISSKGYPYQVFILPLFDEKGARKGILSSAIFYSLKNIGQLFEGLALHPNHFLAILDPAGNTISMTAKKDLSAANSILTYAKDKTKKIFEIDGDRFHFIESPMHPYTLTVLIGINEKVIQQRTHALLRVTFFIITLGFIFTLILSSLLTKRLNQSFSKIYEMVISLDRGDFHHRVQTTDQSEIGDLIERLNHLGAKLEKDQTLGLLWREKSQNPEQ